MFHAVLAWAVCATLEPTPLAIDARTETRAMAAYREARVRASGDANAQVRLALWCESHGMPAERLKHLAIAVMIDPSHTTARGLMGLVAFRGRWQSPEAVSALVKSDGAYAAALARYNGRRARIGDSAEAHWKLSLWCEEQGLKPEAAAHLARVVRLDPGREAAWKRLGFRKQGRRWVTAEQIATERAEAEAQKRADRHWTPILTRWRNRIGDRAREVGLTEALAAVTDPRAVPMVWSILGCGSAAHQMAAVQILGQIDSPDSTRTLALLALEGKSPRVRANAIQILRLRDPRDVASLLVSMLRDPQLDPDPILFHYQLRPVAWEASDDPGVLLFSGPGFNLVRAYAFPEGASPWMSAMPDSPLPERVTWHRQQQIRDLTALIDEIRGLFQDEILAARRHVQQVERSNTRVLEALNAAIGRDPSTDRQAWRKWWAEERGYAYVMSPPPPRQDLTLGESKPTYYNAVHYSCFAAGTPVRTLAGPRPIESLAVGDSVLTQDTGSGALSYRPIIAALRNGPDKVLKIDMGREVIKVTGIHRFWKVGHGWALARDLRPGEIVRSMGGVQTVKSVEPAGVEPVYNLRVLQADCYFAGVCGLLVHDSSEVLPVSRPFDAAPEPASSDR